jgi:glutaredoxin
MWNWLRRLGSIPEWDTMAHHVLVYTRAGCHLCDEACEILERHGLHPNKVDIDQDPQLQQQYTDCVPVVSIDGKIRFRGRVNEVLLKRLLKGRE